MKEKQSAIMTGPGDDAGVLDWKHEKKKSCVFERAAEIRRNHFTTRDTSGRLVSPSVQNRSKLFSSHFQSAFVQLKHFDTSFFMLHNCF